MFRKEIIFIKDKLRNTFLGKLLRIHDYETVLIANILLDDLDTYGEYLSSFYVLNHNIIKDYDSNNPPPPQINVIYKDYFREEGMSVYVDSGTVLPMLHSNMEPLTPFILSILDTKKNNVKYEYVAVFLGYGWYRTDSTRSGFYKFIKRLWRNI